MNFVFLVYNFLTIVLALFAWPILLVKKRARFGVDQKLGLVPASLAAKYAVDDGGQRPVWFHAVSVGEFNAAYPLISKLHEKYPRRPIVVSTSTGTGQNLARQKCSEWADVIYFPYDLVFASASWLDCLKPDLVVIVETELWPGFSMACSKRGIPLSIVNGRMSPRSFATYFKFKAFFGPVLRCFKVIGAQSANEAEKYKKIGGAELPVKVLGNLKFDGLKQISSEQRKELQDRVGLEGHELVIVAGSTHEGEESVILEAYKAIQDKIDARLIIVPRHPERFERAVEIIQSYGFRARKFSLGEALEDKKDVYLLDTIGHLASFYSLAAIAFVGGTLVPIGGHNVAEPCIYALPVLAGPRLEKTQDVADALAERNALRIVHNESEMQLAFEELLTDGSLRRSMGNAGASWLSESLGAVERAIEMLESVLIAPGSRSDTTALTLQAAREEQR